MTPRLRPLRSRAAHAEPADELGCAPRLRAGTRHATKPRLLRGGDAGRRAGLLGPAVPGSSLRRRLAGLSRCGHRPPGAVDPPPCGRPLWRASRPRSRASVRHRADRPPDRGGAEGPAAVAGRASSALIVMAGIGTSRVTCCGHRPQLRPWQLQLVAPLAAPAHRCPGRTRSRCPQVGAPAAAVPVAPPAAVPVASPPPAAAPPRPRLRLSPIPPLSPAPRCDGTRRRGREVRDAEDQFPGNHAVRPAGAHQEALQLTLRHDGSAPLLEQGVKGERMSLSVTLKSARTDLLRVEAKQTIGRIQGRPVLAHE